MAQQTSIPVNCFMAWVVNDTSRAILVEPE